MNIGYNLKLILNEKGMSQYRLAKKSGISQSYVCELISGKYQNPSIEIVAALAKTLKVSITRLISKAA